MKKIALILLLLFTPVTVFAALSTSRPRLLLSDELISRIAYRGGVGTESSYAQTIRDTETWESHKSTFDSMYTNYTSGSYPSWGSFRSPPQMLALVVLHHIYGGTTYSAKAFAYLDTYADNSVQSGNIGRTIAIGYDGFYDDLGAARKERLEHILQVSVYNRYIQKDSYVSTHSIWNGHRLTDEDGIMVPFAHIALAGETLTDATYSGSPLSAETYGTAFIQDYAEDVIDELYNAMAQAAGENGGSHMGIGTYGIHAWTASIPIIAWTDSGIEDLITDWAYSDNIQKHFLFSAKPHKYGSVTFNDDADSDWHSFVNTVPTLLLLDRFETPYNDEFRWMEDKTSGNVYGWHQPFYLMYYDAQEVASTPTTATLGDVLYEDGTGYVIYKSGWDATPSATSDNWQFVFHCGDYYDGHSHLDNLSFQLFYKGDLAIHSGDYPNDTAGAHWANWYRQTVASNSMLLYDPAETLHDYFYGSDIANSGGQVPPYGTICGESTTHRPQCYGDVTVGSEWDRGDIVDYENNDVYLHVVGDATNSYWSGKCDKIQRGYLLLKDAKDVVMWDYTDVPTAKASSVQRRWTWHSMDFPTVTGTIDIDGRNGYGGGTITYSDASLIKITDAGQTYGIVTHSGGNGIAYVSPIFPTANNLVISGGLADDGGAYESDSYEFLINGAQYNITTPEDDTPPTGIWTTYLQADANTESQTFLNAIHVTDSDSDTPETTPITATQGGLVGVQLTHDTVDSVVMIAPTSERVTATIAFSFTPDSGASTNCYAVGLSETETYSINVSGSTTKTVTVDPAGTDYQTSADGLLAFSVAYADNAVVLLSSEGSPSQPTVNAGADQSVSVNTATISGTATAPPGEVITGVTCPGETVTPDDGVWDEQTEAWTCVVTGLPEGQTTKTFTAETDTGSTGTDSVVITYAAPPVSSMATVKGASMKGGFSG